MKRKFVAFDGKEFNNEYQCKEYESKNCEELKEKIDSVFEQIKKILIDNNMEISYDDYNEQAILLYDDENLQCIDELVLPF